MYKDFDSIDSLFETIKADKEANGSNSSTLNRYPIRFVLFDSFRDQYAFTLRMATDMKVKSASIQSWIDADYPDILITHQKLASEIDKYIKNLDGGDLVITPFSEVARFYDNIENKEFDALIRTIKGIESTDKAWDMHQRIYIPIVGLEAKMSTFKEDQQIFIWYTHSDESEAVQRLILTDNTSYGVTGYEDSYYRIKDVKSWVDLWKNQDAIGKQNILCESKSLFSYSFYAKPDNAFQIITCNNVYEFLTKGLQLNLVGVPFKEEEIEYWGTLAKEVDLTKKFDFRRFVHKHFSVQEIDSYQTFTRLWFEHPDCYSHWLACRYMAIEFKGTYLEGITSTLTQYNDIELFSAVADTIPSAEENIECRAYILAEAAKRDRKLPEEIIGRVLRKLEKAAQEEGYIQAIKLFTRISDEEKRLAISWIGEGHIKIDAIKDFYPELYYYLHSTECAVQSGADWAVDYIEKYKASKIADAISPELAENLAQLNGSTPSFLKWYQSLKTTRSTLGSRKDIDVIYWIDGLGIDWINLVAELVKKQNMNNIYLNEVLIARSLLPTVTSVNKADLLKLLPAGCDLPKEGDIDAMAHRSTNVYPQYIVDEVKKVTETINKILQKYAGKKIAIVSDHGLTYLAQRGDGMNLGGYDFYHFGRYGSKKSGNVTSDDSYYTLEDNKTIASLTYRTVGSKINDGQGAHGGCTPEEVLVPIFIISSSPNAKNWYAKAVIDEILASSPIAKFKIIGLAADETPRLSYNGATYALHKNEEGLYESDEIKNLDQNIKTFTVKVGETSEDTRIDVNTGTVVEDQFADFF